MVVLYDKVILIVCLYIIWINMDYISVDRATFFCIQLAISYCNARYIFSCLFTLDGIDVFVYSNYLIIYTEWLFVCLDTFFVYIHMYTNVCSIVSGFISDSLWVLWWQFCLDGLLEACLTVHVLHIKFLVTVNWFINGSALCVKSWTFFIASMHAPFTFVHSAMF